ncbi:unnamed protein product [Closterium sp. Naga37s-1]|nr:unnamed protein product [Closterium sp. Naga37s-1]
MNPLAVPPACNAHCPPSLSASDKNGPAASTLARRASCSFAHSRSHNAPPLSPQIARMGGLEGLRGDGEWRSRALAVPRDTNEPQLRQQYGPRCSVSSPAQRPYVAVLIVPTGVGAEIGGFAGDALPVARAFSSVAECLIAHPNVLNGAMLYWPLPRALYVEGHALDRFARGEWGLQPVHSNRVGLVFDRAIEDDLLQRHLQVADAARATLGIDIVGYTVTDRPLKVHRHRPPPQGTPSPTAPSRYTVTDRPLKVHRHRPPPQGDLRPSAPSHARHSFSHFLPLSQHACACVRLSKPMSPWACVGGGKQVHKWVDGATGAATGRIDEADSLLRAVQTLLDAPLAAHPPSHAHALSPAAAPATGGRGVDAVGVVARFPDDAEEVLQQYREGSGVDVLAGVEAVISHLVVRRFQLPAAHAPALAPLPLLPSIAPRSAAEEVSADPCCSLPTAGHLLPAPPDAASSSPPPRTRAPQIGHTFLPCVLAGLSRAPRLVTRHAPPGTAAERMGAGEGQEGQEGAANASSIPTIIGGAWDYSGDAGSSSSGTSMSMSMSMSSSGGGGGVVWAEDVDCVVLPVDAFGGPAAQALAHRPGGPVSAAPCHAVLLSMLWAHSNSCTCSAVSTSILIVVPAFPAPLFAHPSTCLWAPLGAWQPLFIAVEENTTVMDDPPSKFAIPAVSFACHRLPCSSFTAFGH